MLGHEKVALVSGASRGLGLAIVKRLNAKGVYVFAGCRDEESGKDILSDIIGRGVEVVKLDVKDEQTVEEVYCHIEQQSGRLDMLINNAGVCLDLDPNLSIWERYQYTFDVNVLGSALLTEGMLPLLRQGSEPRMINISSSLASFTLRTDPSWAYASMQLPFYQASKAALNALTISQSEELTKQGISVKAICPGLTATDATQFKGRSTEESATMVARLALEDWGALDGLFFDDQGIVPW